MRPELNILSCHGQFVKVTGMEEIITSTGLKTVGLTTALCEAYSLKNTSYSAVTDPCFLQTLEEGILNQPTFRNYSIL